MTDSDRIRQTQLSHSEEILRLRVLEGVLERHQRPAVVPLGALCHLHVRIEVRPP